MSLQDSDTGGNCFRCENPADYTLIDRSGGTAACYPCAIAASEEEWVEAVLQWNGSDIIGQPIRGDSVKLTPAVKATLFESLLRDLKTIPESDQGARFAEICKSLELDDPALMRELWIAFKSQDGAPKT